MSKWKANFHLFLRATMFHGKFLSTENVENILPYVYVQYSVMQMNMCKDVFHIFGGKKLSMEHYCPQKKHGRLLSIFT